MAITMSSRRRSAGESSPCRGDGQASGRSTGRRCTGGITMSAASAGGSDVGAELPGSSITAINGMSSDEQKNRKPRLLAADQVSELTYITIGAPPIEREAHQEARREERERRSTRSGQLVARPDAEAAEQQHARQQDDADDLLDAVVVDAAASLAARRSQRQADAAEDGRPERRRALSDVRAKLRRRRRSSARGRDEVDDRRVEQREAARAPTAARRPGPRRSRRRPA